MQREIVILNTKEQATVSGITVEDPKDFIRISKTTLLAPIEENVKKKIGIVYIYEKHSDGTYHFAGIMDFTPVEQDTQLKTIKRPMNITILNAFAFGANKHEEYRIKGGSGGYSPSVVYAAE